MTEPTSKGKKPVSKAALFLGLLGAFLPTAASLALIVPAIFLLGFGWYQWAWAKSPAVAVLFWLWSLVLLAESFNYEGSWKRGRAAATRFLAAVVFFAARISGILFCGLTAISAMFYGHWLLATLSLGLFLLVFSDFSRRLREQALDDEHEEARRLRQAINPEQFKRQAEWKRKVGSK